MAIIMLFCQELRHYVLSYNNIGSNKLQQSRNSVQTIRVKEMKRLKEMKE
jgi:hypothetical protein